MPDGRRRAMTDMRLAQLPDGLGRQAGYVGMITANSFMKREFGKKLIEQLIPTWDLTHVIDTSGAYIPGHGTPTVILVGRNTNKGRFSTSHCSENMRRRWPHLVRRQSKARVQKLPRSFQRHSRAARKTGIGLRSL